jgi:hypothetical protein
MQTESTVEEQMEYILDEVDALLFTDPQVQGDPRHTWRAELGPRMHEVQERVGKEAPLVYLIAINQTLRYMLDARFRTRALSLKKRMEGE